MLTVDSLAFSVVFTVIAAGFASSQSVQLDDETCVPGECRCRGDLPQDIVDTDEGRPAARRLREGVECIVADFDGNELPDFAIPTWEGHATVLMTHTRGSVTAIEIDAGGVMDLYSPRDSPGPNGEPRSAHHAILVRWVGQCHAVFIWETNGFKRHYFPASHER